MGQRDEMELEARLAQCEQREKAMQQTIDEQRDEIARLSAHLLAIHKLSEGD